MTGESAHTASDVRDLSGLTYRMLHVWEKAGLLPERQTAGSWRRFTPREMFMLFVLVEFRRRFQVPLPKLKYVRDFMLQDGADHLSAAIDLMSILGVPVYLATDFKAFFVMDSALEFQDLLQLTTLPDGVSMLHVNPIVKRILGALPDPIEIDDSHGAGRRHRAVTQPQGNTEMQLLEILHLRRFDKVEIHMKKGLIHRFVFDQKREIDADRLGEILNEHDFQKLEIQQLHGNIASITQRVTMLAEPDDLEVRRAASIRDTPDHGPPGNGNE
jgi:hypothetical protein